MKKEPPVENHGIRLLGDVWSSMALHPPRLNCEQTYYQAKLLTPEVPQSIYRCVAQPRPRGRSAFQDYRKDSNVKLNSGVCKSEMRISRDEESPQSCQTRVLLNSNPAIVDSAVKTIPQLDRAVINSLRKEVEIESKQAVCILALKKKIARFCSGQRVEIKKIRKKRGRPPKRRVEAGVKEGGDESVGKDPTPIPHHAPCLKLRIPCCKTEGNLSTNASPTSAGKLAERSQSWPSGGMRLKRKSRVEERRYLFEDLLESEEELEGEVNRKDEELALQLHLDLNAPRLRKRHRSLGMLSGSSSEQ